MLQAGVVAVGAGMLLFSAGLIRLTDSWRRTQIVTGLVTMVAGVVILAVVVLISR